MAFKTNSIRLKEYADSSGAPASYDGTATNGDLAIVGSTLKLRTGGNWVAISGGGGGASNLADLGDVPSAPSVANTVGLINGSNQLTFDFLSVSNIATAAIYTESDVWTANDTTLATTAAIQDWVEGQSYLTSETSHADVVVDGDFASEGLMRRGNADGVYSVITDNSTNWDQAYGWGSHDAQNYVQNYTAVNTTLGDNVAIGDTVLNQKYVVTGAPAGYKYQLTGPATDYEDNQIIEIINMSSSTHAVTLTGGGSFYHTNGGVGATGADISIGPGQRALIMPDTGANLHYITILTA